MYVVIPSASPKKITFFQPCFVVCTSLYKSFTFLVKFISKYFILIDAIVNGFVFLIPFLDYSLLVYRNSTEFFNVLMLLLILQLC